MRIEEWTGWKIDRKFVIFCCFYIIFSFALLWLVEAKKIMATIVTIFPIVACLMALRREFFKRQPTKTEEYYYDKLEYLILREKGCPPKYLNSLGKKPEIKNDFYSGYKYEEESKVKEAIEKYKQCLSHPRSTNADKVAANIYIGNCYYNLSKLEEAGEYYKKALKISNKLKTKFERLQGKAVALGNIGLIYCDLGQLKHHTEHTESLELYNEALKYYTESLELYRKIDYEQGIAIALGNIGLIYRCFGEHNDNESLKYFQHNEALKYLKESLELYKKIGDEPGITHALSNIGHIYTLLGRHNKALKYYKKALIAIEQLEKEDKKKKQGSIEDLRE